VKRLLVTAFVLTALVGCSDDDDPGSLTIGGSTSTAPVLPEGACVARMSNANPGQGGSETLIVDSHFAGKPFVVIAHYKSTNSTYSGSVDANKHGEISFSIGQPTAGYPVNVDVTVGTPPDGEKCQTSFTPH
jgi:hypothetical protein